MATIEIKTPDGKTLELNSPDGATPDQIHQAAMAAASHYQSQLQPQQSTYQKLSSPQPVSPQVQNIADQLNVPSRMGRGVAVGIGNAAQATGIMPTNIMPSSPVSEDQIPRIVNAVKDPMQTLRNLRDSAMRGYQGAQPGFQTKQNEVALARGGEMAGNAAAMIAGGSGITSTAGQALLAGGTNALSQAQSGQVKLLPDGTVGLPDSVVGNAAIPVGLKAMEIAAPAVKTALRAIGAQGESMSGGKPGSLEAAYKDPSLISASGKKVVSGQYEAQKGTGNMGGGIRRELTDIGDKQDFIDKAAEIAKNGDLTPEEALAARKELDASKKKFTDIYYRTKREIFDNVAKQAFAGADESYKRAVMAESLRNIFPQNKYGGASAFKTMLLKLTGGIAAPLLSPALQGAAATGAGIAARNVISPAINNPATTALISSLLAQQKKRGAQ